MTKRKANPPGNKKEDFLLSSSEIQDPRVVFKELFDAYDIEGLRHRLRDIMESALFDRDCDAQSYFFLFRQLEKLVEAVHLVSQNSHTIEDGNKEDQLSTEEQLDEKFYKPPRFEEIASIRPLEALGETFGVYGPNELIDEIEKWKRCVMTGAIFMYDEVGLRDQFWTFCDQLMCLVESAYFYFREQKTSEKQEMENFYSNFTLTYAQRELWDCFEAVANDDRNDTRIDRKNIIQTYRCLLSVIVASYYLLENSEPEKSVMPFDREAV